MVRGALAYGAGDGGGTGGREPSDDEDEDLAIDPTIEFQRHHKKLEKLTAKQIVYILTNIPGTALTEELLDELGAGTQQKLKSLRGSVNCSRFAKPHQPILRPPR